MAFGQQKVPGRGRGRPPKDPAARQYQRDTDFDELGGSQLDMYPYKARKLDANDAARPMAALDPELAVNTVDEMEAALRDMRTRYEQNITERVLQATRERDAIQAQFDRLKELRVTQSEKTLVEWKRANLMESLSSWKHRAEHAERRLKEVEQADAVPSSDPATARHTQKLEREVQRLADKLSAARTELDAQVARNNTLEQQAPSTGDDKQAIRRMYEDLTGFIVRYVELPDPTKALHRFQIVYTGPDSHDLEFSLEESQLHTDAPRGAMADIRDDFVYVPNLDEVRDAKLLTSETMPDHFLEPIRFERSAAIKFANALHRSLKK
ncbi:hypothetical protein MVES_003294 [Malassezia vespertilionis]|uniref:Monopolin complex subunit Csm1/Pcs1 C-terminal domain-containing protein n=1 Tax=Malassezia vespertilionis TaxID=2020962 RepID=A0A2N1J8A0_9BASI|nr:hypothetical protein MVES_003294 [Malassezia vespertilionis]